MQVNGNACTLNYTEFRMHTGLLVHELLKTLSVQDQFILYQIASGARKCEVAKMLNLPESTVRYHEKMALNKLKKRIHR